MKKWVLSGAVAGLLICGEGAQGRALTVDQAVRTAMEKNRTLAGARSEVSSAMWGVRKAYATWMPKVEVNSGVTRLNDASVRLANAPIDFIRDAPGLPAEVKDNIRPFAYKDAYGTSVTVVQPIYNGGMELAGIGAATALKERGDHVLRDTEQEVISRVRKAYYSALKAQELVGLSQEKERRTLSYLASTRRKAEAGMRTNADVLRWEAQAASDRGNVIEAGNGLAMARAALNEVMGVGLEEDYALETPPEAAVVASGGDAPASTRGPKAVYDPEALGSHPGVLATKSLVRLQKTALQRAWGGFKPQVHLAFSYAWEKNNTVGLDGTKTWSTAVNVGFPVFSGFGDYAAVRQAREDVRRAGVFVEDVTRQVQLRARNAALSLDSARERIVIARKGSEYAEANLQTVTRRYEAGVASNIDLIDAQTTAYQARALLIQATHDAAIAGVELERATGRIE